MLPLASPGRGALPQALLHGPHARCPRLPFSFLLLGDPESGFQCPQTATSRVPFFGENQKKNQNDKNQYSQGGMLEGSGKPSHRGNDPSVLGVSANARQRPAIRKAVTTWCPQGVLFPVPPRVPRKNKSKETHSFL